jgi:hypothetical protein
MCTSLPRLCRRRRRAIKRIRYTDMSNAYCRYYESQRGGEIPVFRGGLQQSGAGLGDVLRGIFRWLAPAALRGIRTFAGSTLAATQAGLPLALAAKSAILPTISSVAGDAAPTVAKFVNAVLPGLVTTTTTPAGGNATASTVTSARQQSGSGILFEGENGIPSTDKAVNAYKRGVKRAAALLTLSSTTTRRQQQQQQKHSGASAAKRVHYNF